MFDKDFLHGCRRVVLQIRVPFSVLFTRAPYSLGDVKGALMFRV